MSDGQLMSIFMIPRSQGGTYCSVHNGMYIPVDRSLSPRRRLVRRGHECHRLHDPSSPVEIAYYDATASPAASDAWSSYWYNGKIYANDIGARPRRLRPPLAERTRSG